MAWGLKDKELGLSQKEKDNYSLNRALAVLCSPHSPSARQRAGFELDVSDQICKRDNRATDGIIIPHEILDHEYRSRRPAKLGGHILTDQMVRGLPPPSHMEQKSGTYTEADRVTEADDVDLWYGCDSGLLGGR